MLFAEKEISKNPAEYVLYLWQMEDLLRAINFDMNMVEKLLASSPDMDDVTIRRERTRYQLLIAEMRDEGILETGHLAKGLLVMTDLQLLHQSLIQKKDKAYLPIYQEALPNIHDFIGKSGRKSQTEVEACFQALYGLLILRLKKEPVTPQTQEAMDTFSKMLAYLAAKAVKS
ncbi:MAG: DUF4924 family protein [Bacteroidota bacterium]